MRGHRLFAVAGDELVPAAGTAGKLAAPDDVNGAFGAHDGKLRPWPGEDGVGTERAGVHYDVRTAEGLAQHDGYSGDGRFGERIEQFGALADDAAALLCSPRQEAGGGDEDHAGQTVGVAHRDEARALLCRVDILLACQMSPLVGDDSWRAAFDPCEADHEI